MRNAKIISYKVKGSFQHNCSMFAERKIFLPFFSVDDVFFSSHSRSPSSSSAAAPEPSQWYCVLLKAKTKPIFHFVTIIFSTLYEPRQKRGEYLKNDEKFLFSCAPFRLPPKKCLPRSSPTAAAFAFIYLPKDYFASLFSVPREGNHRASNKKAPNDDSIQISNLGAFLVRLAFFLAMRRMWCEAIYNLLMPKHPKKNAQP